MKQLFPKVFSDQGHYVELTAHDGQVNGSIAIIRPQMRLGPRP
jgi:hypothetical protein